MALSVRLVTLLRQLENIVESDNDKKPILSRETEVKGLFLTLDGNILSSP